MTKIISFTGSQGSGKTTMQKLLVDRLTDKGYRVASAYAGVENSISRDAKADGFIINENTNFESQYYIASRYISADILTRKYAEKVGLDFIILDRSVLDVIPYTQVSDNINDDETKIIEDMLLVHFNLYPIDLMIYCRPISKLIEDGVRSINEKFSEDIDEKFFKIIMDGRIKQCYPKNMLKILENDTLENRMKVIDEYVEMLI